MSEADGARALHPRLTAAEKRTLAARGSELFAGGEFFAAHEAWEEIWRSTDPTPRELYQALVQMAAAFHHLRARQRPDVARRVLGKARARLRRLVAAEAPLDVTALDAALAGWERWLGGERSESGAEPALPALRWRDRTSHRTDLE